MKRKNRKRQVTEPTKDTSPTVPQRNKLKIQLTINKRVLNEKQKSLLEMSLNKDNKIIFISGPAGSAKTYISVLTSLELLNEKRVSDLIYIRSAVESSDAKLGFLPGEANEKMAPYLQPLMDKLSEFLPKSEIDVLLKEERVTSIPVGFLRGLNWNAKAIIVDESQNLSYKELFTLITRIGDFSKVFIIGDPEQSDIGKRSGFEEMMRQFDDEESKSNGIRIFKLGEDDIVRSGLVRFIIKKTKKPV